MTYQRTLDFRRFYCRSAPVVSGNKIGGYAAIFNELAPRTDLGQEEIAPGAFDRALQHSDVRALFNHDPNVVLGRQRAGTLRLSVDSTGLEYEIDLPPTQQARDLRVLIERGDIDGASFHFIPDFEQGVTYDQARRVTRHTDIAELIDVSTVTYPAYAGATSETRSWSPESSRRSHLIRIRHATRWSKS